MMHQADAVYRDETIDEFRYNPLTEALPERLSPMETSRALMIRPHYSPDERQAPDADRLSYTPRIARVHQPMNQEIDVCMRIDRCIRWGYADRSPMSREFIDGFLHERNASPDPLSYHPHTYGFSILGVSGLGKTTTVEAILSRYPQVIRHHFYRGVPLEETQVVWMKLDCPGDGRPKGLCLSFFEQLDVLTGASYYQQYRRSTLDAMMTVMASLCRSFHVGILIIDEIQHLCSAQKGVSAGILNFLVNIVNQTGIPVITIGTPKALAILQSEFQQAKRGSGQGDSLWERMQNDAMWSVFCQSVWQYQYTRDTVPITKKMSDTLYNESLGIPFLAVHIYKLTQENAILTGKETFSESDIKTAARDKMGLTRPMRQAIRAGKEVDLKQYVDITPFTAEDRYDHYSMTAESKAPAPSPADAPKKSHLDAATETLMGMGLSYADARKYASVAAAKHSEVTVPSVIAVEGWTLYSADQKNSSDCEKKEPALTDLAGYDQIRHAGLIDDSYAGGAS